MRPDIASVNRLGFEAWADNLIVNAIEDMRKDVPVTLDKENEHLTFVIRFDGDTATATVRAYVDGLGWFYHDRNIKMKGGQP